MLSCVSGDQGPALCAVKVPAGLRQAQGSVCPTARRGRVHGPEPRRQVGPGPTRGSSRCVASPPPKVPPTPLGNLLSPPRQSGAGQSDDWHLWRRRSGKRGAPLTQREVAGAARSLSPTPRQNCPRRTERRPGWLLEKGVRAGPAREATSLSRERWLEGCHMRLSSRPVSPRVKTPVRKLVRANTSVCTPLARAARSGLPPEENHQL